MAPDAAIPEWIEVHTGSRPIILLAPHGGRRSAPRRPGRDKVNDLHTAEVTRELAAACGATCVINARHDRNELDLNRITAVRDRAPWLLAFLADTLDDMLAHAGRATVLVVHGWNVVQAACDLGVGLVEDESGCVSAGDAHPTVSDRFLCEVLRRLQRQASRQDVTVTIGARYPAAHPNNLLQLFTAARSNDAAPAIRRIAALADRVDAVQLELGIPLRWPGPRRHAFAQLLGTTFAAACATSTAGRRSAPYRSRRARSETPSPAADAPSGGVRCGGRVTRRLGLQFIDGELLGMTSLDAGDAGAVAGRLLLSTGSDRLALFTGELATTGALHVPGLEYRELDGRALDVAYRGPLLAFPTLMPFVDLESGLACGELVETSLALHFEPENPAEFGPGNGEVGCSIFGTLRGSVVLGGLRRAFATDVCVVSSRRADRITALPSMRLTLPATPLGGLDLASDGFDAAAGTRILHEGDVLGFTLAGRTSAGTPVTGVCELGIAAECGSVHVALTNGRAAHEFAGALERIIPVRRPGRDGAVVETRYALCRFPHLAPGWLEVSLERPRGV